MSWNHCAISGNLLEDPVVSKKSGHIFERSLIEKHIESMQECPITGQPLTKDDLLPIQISKTIKPRPVNANSIPNLLTIFQSEWDALMLETFQLKQHLETVRQELSHALYQHDAACRVIAKLIRERDEARNDLAQLQDRVRKNEEIEIENGAEKTLLLPSELVQNINDTAMQLNQMRKERKKKADAFASFASQQELSNFAVKNTITLHSTKKPGIQCMNFNSNNERFVVTGGVDGQAIIYDKQDQKIVNTFEKHQKKINEILQISDHSNLNILTCSDDHLGYLYNYNLEHGDQQEVQAQVKYTINQHNAAVTSIAVHPIKTLVAAAAKDNSWSFHDIAKGAYLNKVDQFGSNITFQQIRFHPDGHILGVGGSDGIIKLWSLTDDSVAAQLEGHKESVDLISFSENGFYFASSSFKEGVVKIWDLRKLSNLKTFFEEEAPATKIGSIAFDDSGQYFGIGTDSSVLLYSTKNWDNFSKFESHKDLITNIQFGKNSKNIVSCSLDRHLTFYS